jgi:hypothetical protein
MGRPSPERLQGKQVGAQGIERDEDGDQKTGQEYAEESQSWKQIEKVFRQIL